MTVILVDPRRTFTDGRRHQAARTTADAIALLRRTVGRTIDELWLDFDFGCDRDGRRLTCQPVVDDLVAASAAGAPYRIELIVVHALDSTGALSIARQLRGAGYRVRRTYDRRCFSPTSASDEVTEAW